MNLKTCDVSVVIPTWNAAPFLQEAVDSIWDQSSVPREIIIVDDASTDDTTELAAKLSMRSRVPFRVIKNEINSGSPARPMNIGIQAASANLIAILDQDDVWTRHKLKQQVAVLDRMPEINLVAGLFGFVGNEAKSVKHSADWKSRLTKAMSNKGTWHECDGTNAFELFVKYENFVGGFPGFMFRRIDWQQKGGFDESLRVAADFDFLCWLTQRGKAALITETHYFRREHDGNVTHSEVPRLTDVINILTRYISADQLKRHTRYRKALASKVLRLAQFFCLCDCHQQARQMMRLFYRIRKRRLDLLLMPAHYGQFAIMPFLQDFLQLRHLPKVSQAEAANCVESVIDLLRRTESGPEKVGGLP